MKGQIPNPSGAMLAKVSAFAALGGFLFGYDIALIGGALLFMKVSLMLSLDVSSLFLSSHHDRMISTCQVLKLKW